MSEPHPTRTALFAALAAVYLFWGATFLAVRYAVLVVPPTLIIVIRCTGGALILGCWLAWRRQLERPTLAQWRTAALAGLFLFLGSHVAMAWAEQRMSSGQAALYSSAIPLWMVLLEAARERVAPTLRVMFGLVLGVLGVGLLAGGSAFNGGLLADRLLVSFGALCWAIGSLIGRHGARPAAATQGTAMQLASGAVWTFAAATLHGDLARFSPGQLDVRTIVALLFLVLCGTVIAFASFTWLLRVTSPAAVSSYAFVNPMVALALGVLVGDDRLSARVLVSAGLVVAAVALTIGASVARRTTRPSADALETRGDSVVARVAS